MYTKKHLIQAFVLLALPASTWGATRAVSNAGVIVGCAATYSTIQAAINASAPNDTVVVCNTGVPFNEQVVISKAITLAGQPGAEIQPNPLVANTASLISPFNPIAAAIWVTPGTTGVIIYGLIVDGSLNGISGCLPNPIGIYYQNASGTAAYNAVKNFELGPGLQGCQAGIGIFAQTDGSGGTSTVIAAFNSVHDFQKTGIVGNETGTTLTAEANIVTGVGPTPNIAQNGIQIGFGATGSITGNTVSNVSYSPCSTVANCPGSATGILLYDSSGAIVTRSNNVSSTQGAVVYISVDGGSISGNVISNTLVFDGIDIDTDGSSPGTGNTVSSNTIMNSGESSVYVDTASNSVVNNKFVEAPIGIWFVAAGSSQSGNKFLDIPLSVQSGPGSSVANASLSGGPKPQPAR
jgi:hypothetical protein